MVVKVSADMEEDFLKKVVAAEFLNPYFVINLETYGTEGPDVSVWAAEVDRTDPVLFYLYYGTAQLIGPKRPAAAAVIEAAEFVNEQKLTMLSGPEALIRGIADRLGRSARVTPGVLMCLKLPRASKRRASRRADTRDLDGIAELICSDREIGGHYDVVGLRKQLAERLTHHGCRNYVISDDAGLACHGATYAESASAAVIGGIVTRADVRGRGLASSVIVDLQSDLTAAGKTCYLYCYQEQLVRWYETHGWRKAASYAKLEFTS